MAYRVKWKMISFMHEGKDDWASVDEFKTETECMTIDFPTAVTDTTASYKTGDSVWSLESGLVYITATFNSEADYNSSATDYAGGMPTGEENVRRTKMEVVSAAEV